MIAGIVYPALSGHAPLAALVGSRIFRDFAGDAPAAPYVVWSILATVPSQSVSRFAGFADRHSVSVDVFSTDPAQSDALVVAARDAMEAIGKLSSGPQSLGFDVETRLYRYTLTADVFVPR